MAVEIVSVERVNPAPCQHFRVTADVDGERVSWVEYRDDKSEIDKLELAREAFQHYRGRSLEESASVVLIPDSPSKEAEDVKPLGLMSAAPRQTLWQRAKRLVGLA